jgi:hypothetical protein
MIRSNKIDVSTKIKEVSANDKMLRPSIQLPVMATKANKIAAMRLGAFMKNKCVKESLPPISH